MEEIDVLKINNDDDDDDVAKKIIIAKYNSYQLMMKGQN